VTITANPELLGDLKKFGAFDVAACFNCGNCTAVCPLSNGGATFPRRIIRYGQIGACEHLLASQEVWLCYHCGECSETCPRQADPGEFMASARRYAIASLDPTGLSRLLYTSTLFTVIFLAGLSLLLGAIFLWQSGPMNLERPDLFAFIPFETVHDVGLAAILVALLAMAFGIVRLLRLLRTRGERTIGLLPAIRAVAEELVTEKRYRTCTEEQHAPWYRSRWLMHWAIMWGFLGLAAATAFDYLLMLLSGKVPGQAVPLWQPTRLLGTLAGMLILFGTARALIFRITKPEKYSSHSLASDWLFSLAFADRDGERLHRGTRTLTAARRDLGIRPLSVACDHWHGDRAPVPLHEVRPCRLPAPRPGPPGVACHAPVSPGPRSGGATGWRIHLSAGSRGCSWDAPAESTAPRAYRSG
jgi:ferredoxin